MQTVAFHCPADVLFYGGQAGGGKTDLLLGLGAAVHYQSAIWRRQYSQLDAIIERGNKIFRCDEGKKSGALAAFRGAPPYIGWTFYKDRRRIRLAAMQHEEDKRDWQGHPHDLKGFDEITQFTKTQFLYVSGWLRSTRPGQRKRIVACGNPPQDPEGQWVLDHWAPWLREDFINPAKPGELRFVTRFDEKPEELVWCESKDPITRNGTTYFPQSMTFLPSGLDDNPWYDGGEYRSALQSMPEPLRSQLLYGDFKAGLKDGAWQGIATSWVRAAQARWRALANAGAPGPAAIADQVGIDVSRGGNDRTVLTPRFGNFFGRQRVEKGKLTDDGFKVAQILILVAPDEKTTVCIDVLNVGNSPYDILKKIRHTVAFNGTEATEERSQRGLLKFYNKRALWHWRMREALDPANPDPIAIPDDPELLGDLCAWQWELTRTGIKVEPKEEITKRLGRSPDKGESLIYANVPSARVDLVKGAVVGHSQATSTPSSTGFGVHDSPDSPWNIG